jgi:hypothetical protein
MFTVAICLADRAYGGPEEGGWYYGCGIPSDEHANLVQGFITRDAAEQYAYDLEKTCDALNEGKPDINSVLSEGRYVPVVFEGYPRHWPDRKPTYE